MSFHARKFSQSARERLLQYEAPTTCATPAARWANVLNTLHGLNAWDAARRHGTCSAAVKQGVPMVMHDSMFFHTNPAEPCVDLTTATA
ncbi:hypothetical protein [Xanthomonas hydrangeae]|uniref:hypothetical protein n=1 Tax=Xanthomonas hydrangeae TaxID=2775159 RepID=UPI0019625E77